MGAMPGIKDLKRVPNKYRTQILQNLIFQTYRYEYFKVYFEVPNKATVYFLTLDNSKS